MEKRKTSLTFTNIRERKINAIAEEENHKKIVFDFSSLHICYINQTVM